MRENTIAVHGGQEVDSATNSRALPIYQTSAYVFNDTDHAANLFGLKEAGNIYTRLMNPTTDVLEKRVALLEGGVGALAVASGAAAITYTVLNIVSPGQEIVASAALYGGTYNFFAHTLKNLGIKTVFVDSTNPKDFEAAITDKTRLIYAESIGNPKLSVLDFEKIAEIAHSNKIPFVIDNTVPTPYLFKPFEFGADIVVHSATKFLGGHGTSLGGIIVDSGKFDWAASGKFPQLTEPDPSYHGLSYTETFGEAAFIVKARVQLLRDMGAAISPFNSFLIIQGIETLHLRLKEHSQNALKVAEFLAKSPYVNWVNYPGLENHPDHEIAKKYFKKGFGALIGFGVKGGKPAGKKFIDNLKLLSHLANIGDAKSLVIHPASTTHQQLSPAELEAAGVSEDFIRLSVGIEDAEDIIEDIAQALEAANKEN